MNLYPKSKDEAASHRYGLHRFEDKGYAFQPTRCACEVHTGTYNSHQCYKPTGYGPGEIFCRQHSGPAFSEEKKS